MRKVNMKSEENLRLIPLHWFLMINSQSS